MRIRDRLDQQVPTLSFEFYPPRDEIGFWDLYRTIESLKPLAPDYVSVTCGAAPCTNGLQCGTGLCIDGFCTDACGRCSP